MQNTVACLSVSQQYPTMIRFAVARMATTSSKHWAGKHQSTWVSVLVDVPKKHIKI
jgi:hypothetical protein